MKERGWTPEQIQEAFERGQKYPAINRTGGTSVPQHDMYIRERVSP